MLHRLLTFQTNSFNNNIARDMNWTEGALSRHSKGRAWNADAARQRQYFEKTRARLRLEPSNKTKLASTPVKFVPSYIPQSPAATTRTSSSSRSRTKKSRPNRAAPGSCPVSFDDTTELDAGQFLSIQLGKRNKPPKVEAQPPEDTELLNIETKRRMLLSKSDWTGIELQRPPKIDFSWKRERHQTFGRAAEPERERRRHRKPHHSANHPYEASRHLNTIKNPWTNPKPTEPMRIQVGGKDLRWSHASNTIKSVTGSPSRLTSLSDYNLRHWTPSSSSLHLSSIPRESSMSASSFSSRLQRPPTRLGHQILHGDHRIRSPNERESFRLSGTGSAKALGMRSSGSTKYLIMSSPSTLHHPQPKRGARAPLLDSRHPESPAGDSVIAQPSIADEFSHCGRSDDDNWKKWLHLEDDNQQEKASVHPSSLASYGGSSPYPRDVRHHSVYPPASRNGMTSRNRLQNLSQGVEDIDHEAKFLTLYGAPKSAFNERPESRVLLHVSSMTRPQQVPPIEPRPCSTYYKTGEEPPEDFKSQRKTNVKLLPLDSIRHNVHLTMQSILQPPKAKDLADLLEEQVRRIGQNIPANKETHAELDDDDEDEIWKRFVLDEDAKAITERALQEAKNETKRQLCSPMEVTACDVLEQSLASSEAGFMSPTSSSEAADVPEGTLLLQGSHNGNASSVVAQPGTPPRKIQNHHFRFRQPESFVGRLANSKAVVGQESGRYGLADQGIKKRRQRKRDHKRPDIRAMPNINGDPIEESP